MRSFVLFQEFLLAIDVTSAGTPEEKLKWAFRMYDVDGNGVIDVQEMTKIVQVCLKKYLYSDKSVEKIYHQNIFLMFCVCVSAWADRLRCRRRAVIWKFDISKKKTGKNSSSRVSMDGFIIFCFSRI